MLAELKKFTPVELRSLGFDERWLQNRITDDPKLLGLGELEVVTREHRQPVGGRIDFLMRDEEETFFEVEVMLGRLDESHIIRSIEYWDLERQRRPLYDHRAVIVAEQITSRFFNVIRLLNRAVPMIAVQLNAFRLDDNSIGLFPVTILDVVGTDSADIIDPLDRTDRPYWEKKVDSKSLSVVDTIVSALRAEQINPRLTFNRNHIAMGTTGNNFCWFRPRKTPGHCHISLRANGSSEPRETSVAVLQSLDVDASPTGPNNISFSTTADELSQHLPVILHVLRGSEAQSRK